MNVITRETGRRRFMAALAAGSASLWAAPGLFAEALALTPRQTEGPFYPDKLPLDTDNDLLIVNDSATPALGRVTHLTGRVLTESGEPVRNALVEIWQVDNNGCYLHSGSSDKDKQDAHFQGFGRFLTGSKGEYYFRTIKPVPYRPRTSHIHYAVHVKGRPKFTTQLYVKGEPLNEGDGILRSVTDPRQRENIIREFSPIEGSPAGELSAHFEIVLGYTPEG